MILPDNISDEALEFAAQIVERYSLLDIASILGRRKRQREDANLRMRARQEQRREIAAHLRAMMARPELSATAVLARLAALSDDYRHDSHLADAWPLAWRGWVKIIASISCASNIIPPEIEYRIRLTERGQEVLAAQRCERALKEQGIIR